jgi:predicted TIM-barrel fold metal-dependent hydrolase
MEHSMDSSNKIKIIDPHCHLWDLSLGYHAWLNSQKESFLGDLSPIRHDYFIEDYLADSSSFTVEKIIHIEAVDSRYAINEVNWLDLRYPDESRLGGIVAGINLLDPKLGTTLESYQNNSRVKGARQLRSDLLNPLWREKYALLGKHELSFDMQISPLQLNDAVTLAHETPDTTMIINHAGMPNPAYLERWKQGIAALAEQPNVFMKLSGFGMCDHKRDKAAIRYYIEYPIEHFGVERCMFASNFPVDRLYASYAETMGSYLEIVSHYSENEKDRLFRTTAKDVYRVT